MTSDWQQQAMDALIDEPAAFFFYVRFMHLPRPFFAITPKMPNEEVVIASWPESKRAKAVAILIERGFISEIVEPWGATGIYTSPAIVGAVHA